MPDPQTNSNVTQEAITRFNDRVQQIGDVNSPAGQAAFLDAIKQFGVAIGQEELFNNFVDNLKERQNFLREFPETAATDALEVLKKARDFEIALQNRAEEEYISRFGRIQDSRLGRALDLQTRIPEAILSGAGLVSTLASAFQGVCKFFGMDDLAERAQSVIDWASNLGEQQTDRIRQVEEGVQRAGGENYNPRIRSNEGTSIDRAIEIAQGSQFNESNIRQGREEAETELRRGTGSYAQQADGPGTRSPVKISPRADMDNATSDTAAPAAPARTPVRIGAPAPALVNE